MITKDTGIIEAVQNHPEIMEVFAEYGLGCIGCSFRNHRSGRWRSRHRCRCSYRRHQQGYR